MPDWITVTLSIPSSRLKSFTVKSFRSESILSEQAGRDYYHRICRFDMQYDEHHCDKQFDKIMDKGYGDVTIGTIIYYMQQKNLI